MLQIAAVTVDAEGEIVDRWSTLVKLAWRFQRVGPTDIHGITRPMLRDAPRMNSALDELAVRLDQGIFTAHNASFDAGFITRAARRRPGYEIGARLCTLRMSRRLDPDRTQSHRLGDVAERYGVELINAHNALADAEATAEVLPHLLAAHHITDVSQLTAFYDR